MPGSGITGLNGAYIFNFHMLGELSSIKMLTNYPP